MDDGARVKLIEIAHGLAVQGQGLEEDAKIVLPRFRTYYRHLAATVEMSDTPGGRDRLEGTAKDLEGLK